MEEADARITRSIGEFRQAEWSTSLDVPSSGECATRLAEGAALRDENRVDRTDQVALVA
jgi:hypothetical protein